MRGTCPEQTAAGQTRWSVPLCYKACPARPGRRVRGPRSLEGDGGAGALEGSLGLLRNVLGNLLQDRLRGAVDEVLGLLQAEARERADLLDDLDLLFASGLEDDVELVLLLDLGRSGSAAAGRGNGNGGRSGDTEGVLEQLHELRELDQRHFLERLDELCIAELCHGGSSFLVIRAYAVSGVGDGSSSSDRVASAFVATRGDVFGGVVKHLDGDRRCLDGVLINRRVLRSHLRKLGGSLHSD